MKFYIKFFLVLVFCLLLGCSTQHEVASVPPKMDNLPVAKVNGTATTSQTNEGQNVFLPEANITMRQLEALISKLSGVDYNLRQDQSDSPFLDELRKNQQFMISSDNNNKFWVFQQLKDIRLKTGSDFYAFVKSPQWQGWRYYINETEWKWTYNPLSKQELEQALPGYSYLSYTNADSDWIDVDVMEKPIITSLGPVVEYRMFMIKYNQFGYVGDEWQPTVVLYKVPCSQQMVVYLRPKRGLDLGIVVQLNQKRADFLENWDREIAKKQALMINYSEEIMGFCGVQKDMFTGLSLQDYSDHYRVVVNKKVYFKELFNFSFDARVSLEERPPYDTFHVKDVNLTFLDNDHYMSIRDFHVSAKILINDSGWVKDYAEVQLVGNPVPFDTPVHKNMRRYRDVTFSANATIIVIPYLGTVDTFEPWRYYIGSPLVKELS